jgi:hypothetical protein
MANDLTLFAAPCRTRGTGQGRLELCVASQRSKEGQSTLSLDYLLHFMFRVAALLLV